VVVGVREFIRPVGRTFGGFVLTAEEFSRSPPEWRPGKERVLVLAPHMDDEVIGCGGAVALHVRAGASVSVAYLTDGRLGSAKARSGSLAEREAAQREVVGTRKQEARAALAVLGVKDAYFIDAEDGAVAKDPHAASRLAEILTKVQPEIVYLPFFLEQHPDHRAVSDVLIAAAQTTRQDFMCYGYEVWTPLYPNRFVWIDSIAEVKKQALAQYHSQLAETPFEHAMLGLNAYRSMLKPGGKKGQYAEAYCALRLPEYSRLYRTYRHAAATAESTPVTVRGWAQKLLPF
jgi:LmbE family N-acetylglucosaminyl deacetylase